MAVDLTVLVVRAHPLGPIPDQDLIVGADRAPVKITAFFLERILAIDQ